ncbi:hypothetical protein [Streptomyces sp.]|uniref:hypothetical protein n=1 Tax=Streptomyces sp. TaxID=1931 RepID=UPI002F3FF448
MEWLLLLLVAGGGGLAARQMLGRRSHHREEVEELDGIRQLADEDVTYLGEQLQRLDAQVAGQPLGADAQLDYQAALDAYETARREVPRIRKAEDVSTVTTTLSAGRYALACVQARVAGTPLPEPREPCFFNPQHGPSTVNVVWTQPGRGTRSVPACAQDAARVADHQPPEIRKVAMGSRKVPYWDAGAGYQPYADGYFAGSAVMMWAFQPPIPWGGGGASGSFDGADYGGGGYDGGGGGDGGGGYDGGGGGDGGGGN